MGVYLKCDLYLLPDIFENFKDMCLANYDLYLAYYYTSPNLFWDACLKMTKMELNLNQESDSEINLMFEAAKRGRIAGTVSNRFVVDHECTSEGLSSIADVMSEKINGVTGFIEYWDANSLYP